MTYKKGGLVYYNDYIVLNSIKDRDFLIFYYNYEINFWKNDNYSDGLRYDLTKLIEGNMKEDYNTFISKNEYEIVYNLYNQELRKKKFERICNYE